MTERTVFAHGDEVMDGDVPGIVTDVFNSFDDLGEATPCLSVRLSPGSKENFSCTRQDWWRLVLVKFSSPFYL